MAGDELTVSQSVQALGHWCLGVSGSQGVNGQSDEVIFHKALEPLLFSPNALEGLFADNMEPKKKHFEGTGSGLRQLSV